MLDISSNALLVSSTEEACSLDPEESWLLAIETWRAAEAVCSAPRSRFAARSCSALFVLLVTCHAMKIATTAAIPRAIEM